MRRISTFVFGMMIGAAVLYAALHFHVVRADDGFHMVAKVESTLASTYVDIREFTVGDWTNHQRLAAALLRAEKQELMRGAAGDALRNGFDNLLQGTGPQS